MTARDDTTLDFYAAEAQPYASRSRAADEERLNAFLARLPSGARILELGCGGGQDSEWMLARGFDVTPTDGSPELAREAEKRLGRPVRLLLFENLCEHAAWRVLCELQGRVRRGPRCAWTALQLPLRGMAAGCLRAEPMAQP